MKTTLRVVAVIVLLLLNRSVFSQQLRLGDNPYGVEKSAVLELSSNNQGLLLPRISDTTSINSLNPPDGMMIYFTPDKRLLLRSNGYCNRSGVRRQAKQVKGVPGGGSLVSGSTAAGTKKVRRRAAGSADPRYPSPPGAGPQAPAGAALIRVARRFARGQERAALRFRTPGVSDASAEEREQEKCRKQSFHGSNQ